MFNFKIFYNYYNIMSYIVNLDDYKPLFMDCINKLDSEVGFSLFVNPNDLNEVTLQASIGEDKKAVVHYDTIVKIITNPTDYKDGLYYNPPKDFDFITSISDYFKGNQVSIKVEKRGMWVWKPNVELITLINKVMPEYLLTLKEFTLNSTFDDVFPASTKFNNDLISLFKTITRNVFYYNIFVSYDEKIAKNEYPYLEEVYKKRISLDEYYNYMSNILNEKDVAYGFDISFVPWDTSLNINVYYNEFSEQILNNMKNRKNHIWYPEDKDLLIKRIKKTKDLKIVLKE